MRSLTRVIALPEDASVSVGGNVACCYRCTVADIWNLYHRQPSEPEASSGSAMTRVSDLIYFTHEVGGRLYGGWYRPAGETAIELYARGQVRKAKLGRMS